jgi:hypothetical protein
MVRRSFNHALSCHFLSHTHSGGKRPATYASLGQLVPGVNATRAHSAYGLGFAG